MANNNAFVTLMGLFAFGDNRLKLRQIKLGQGTELFKMELLLHFNQPNPCPIDSALTVFQLLLPKPMFETGFGSFDY